MSRNTPPEKDENANHVNRLWGRHEGEDFLVVGTGPSVSDFDWRRLRGLNTIALNDAVKIEGFEPAYHLFSDVGIWKRYKDLRLSPRTTVVCQRGARKNFLNHGRCTFKPQVWQFAQTGVPDQKPGSNDLYVSRTVATGGIQLAWKLGARRVALMGVDGYRLDQRYYHDGTSKGKERRKESRLPDGRIVQDRHTAWQSNMRDLRKFFKRRKLFPGPWPAVGVYNLSASSTIDAWEKVDLEVALAAFGAHRPAAYVVSYPRSGSNWLVSLVHAAALGKPRDQWWAAANPEEALLRPSHGGACPWGRAARLPLDVGRWGCAATYDGARVVLLVRDPRDSTLSVWRLLGRRRRGRFRGFGTFFRSNVGLRYNVAWLNRWAAIRPPGVLVLRYEDLCADTCVWLKRVLDYLRLEGDVERALRDCEFDLMQRRLPRSGPLVQRYRWGRPGTFALDPVVTADDARWAQKVIDETLANDYSYYR